MSSKCLDKEGKLILLLIILFSLALRLFLFGINSAEYTDGIVQITLFENENKFWPPVYTILIGFVRLLGVDGISAGKLISIVSGVLTIIPIFLLSYRAYNKRTAIFAAILFSIAPMSLRWNIRVMTDSLFVFLSTLIFYLCFVSNMGNSHDRSPQPPAEKLSIIPFSVAVFLIPILILTRYQGIIFLPFILLCYIIICKNRKRIEVLPIISLVSFLLIFFWLKYRGVGHSIQFIERAGSDIAATVKNYAIIFESFLAYMPFFVTYPVFLLMIYTFFKSDFSDRNKKHILYFSIYYFVALLVLQTMFQSFQERYFYPIIPFASIFAGRGIDLLINEKKIKASVRYILIILSFSYVILLSSAVLYFQRDSFGDLRSSAEFLKTTEENAVIFSNEDNHSLPPCIKDKYWSGRNIILLDSDYLSGKKLLPEGCYLCLHSAYGGFNGFRNLLMALGSQYNLEELYSSQSTLYPIFPDIMQEPYFHQNPLALTVRYSKQTFYSYIFRVSRK